MGKYGLRFVMIAIACMVAATFACADAYVTVMHFNDIHGHLQAKDSDAGIVGGMARIATSADGVRDWNDAHGVTTLFLEAGDILQGTPLSTVYKGEPDFKCLNLMELDAMCSGNHEFDFGQANFITLRDMADFPILSANIVYEESGERYTPPFMLFTLADGTKGAIIGLTAETTPVQTAPKNVEGLRFTGAIGEAKQLVEQLRGQADFIVALTHIGFSEDKELARRVPDIDLIIGGHSHTQLDEPVLVGRTLICQAGNYGEYLGQVDMLVRNGDIVKHRGFLRPMDKSIKPDAEVQAVIDSYAGKLDERFGEVVAQTTVKLGAEKTETRLRETNLGNLICDIIRDYAKADVALWNAGGIRASVEPGPVTIGDVVSILPFGNIVATKELTGAELREVLAYNAAQERPWGGFLQVSGLTMEIEGDRLANVTVGGAPLDDAKTYVVAMSEFMLDGGDGYAMLKEGADPVYLGFSENHVVLEGLRERGTVSPQVEGRIVIR